MTETKQGRCVLITGAAGFIGSTYANMAVTRYPNDRFVLLDCLTPVADMRNIDESTLAAHNCVFEKVDIRDLDELRRVFDTHHITDVIHFAAETHVDVSIAVPSLFISTNVVGTHNLLALAREKHIKRFHYISTDEVYGDIGHTDPPFTEESPLLPNSVYSASKASGDHLVRAYNRTFGLDTVITRSSNNYGPRQDKTKLIPLFLSRLFAGEKVPLYGNGMNTRDWIFVEDNVEGIDTVFRNGTSGEVYNIGGGYEQSNLDITRALLDLTERTEDAIEFVADRPGHDLRYAILTDKVRSLGWSPKMEFANGLAKTVDYYRKNP
jgi:dTDP-glucose 4,6-dehydratase